LLFALPGQEGTPTSGFHWVGDLPQPEKPIEGQLTRVESIRSAWRGDKTARVRHWEPSCARNAFAWRHPCSRSGGYRSARYVVESWPLSFFPFAPL